jgi:hypothetical protein
MTTLPTLLFTDRYLNPVADPLETWSEIDVMLRFNEPGSGTFKMPASTRNMAALQLAHRVQVVREGSVFIGGPVEKNGPFNWSASGGGPGEVQVYFADDSAMIANKVTYPDPTSIATEQTAESHWALTSYGEDVMRKLVDANAGPGSLPFRRVPQLALGALQSLGLVATITSRFEPLGEALRRTALAGGGLGYQVRQVGRTLYFEVYQPTDKSASVRFSRDLGNLRAFSYELESPTVTSVIVAGQGEGTLRTIREITDSGAETAWWRSERFLDQRQTDIVEELDQAGAEALGEGGEQVRLSTITIDTPDQTYGEHYGLGDVVGIELTDNFQITEVVRAVHYQCSPRSGEVITATIGSQDATRDPEWLKTARSLARRLGQLERQ